MAPRTRSATKRKRSQSMMVTEEDNVLILNDLVSLPIIISDYDEIVANKRRASAPAGVTKAHASSTSTTSDSSSETTPHTRWSTGFNDFADQIWDRMTGSMKAKLREACFEVLKRTDEPKTERWNDHDDNTRLLD